uniref:SH2 domain-containing protein n=1 Tax=Electrophorus electricus TaxID=8005 RepID=A0A4W4HJU9_ELEEL
MHECKVAHTQGPVDGSLYAQVQKKESLDGAVNGLPARDHVASVAERASPASHALPLPVANHPLPAADHALSVSSDSGNSTASVKTDRTDDAQQSVSSCDPVSQPAPDGPVSPRERREFEQLLTGFEGQPLLSRQGFLPAANTSPGAGVRHLVPAQVHVNGRTGAERETDILDDELPDSQVGDNSADSLGTLSSFEGRDAPAEGRPRTDSAVVDVDGQQGELPDRRPATASAKAMPVHQVRGSSSAQECLMDYGGQNGGMYRSQSYGAPLLDGGPPYMPQAPKRSTSSREAVQRGLGAWHQYGLMDDPFFGPDAGLPGFPARGGTSQRDVEQSIEVLSMLMLDLEPHTPVPKSQSAPPGDTSAAFQPFTQTLARPSYQADQVLHGYADGQPPSASASFGQSSRRSSPAYAMTPPADIHLSPYLFLSMPGSRSHMITADEASTGTRRRTTSEGHYRQGQEDLSPTGALRSPGHAFPPGLVNTTALNPGGRPKDMDMPRQVLSGFLYYLSQSPFLSNLLFLCPFLSLPLPLSLSLYFFLPPSLFNSTIRMNEPGHSMVAESAYPSFPTGPIRAPLFPDPLGYLDPEEATVNVMGVHRVPGSPNTLHRTVATNTPPSPALQRRLASQSSPGMGRRMTPTNGGSEPTTPSSPLLGRGGRFIPPSPVLNRHPSLALPTPQNPNPRAWSRQSTSSTGPNAPPTPPIPTEQRRVPEWRREGEPSGEREASDNRPDSTTSTPPPATAGLSTRSPAPKESAFVSIYGKNIRPSSSPSGSMSSSFLRQLITTRSFTADGPPDIKLNVKFVQDTSKFWYKPDISREQAISLLKDREPGAFLIRDSHSFRGAYGLAMKVACPPPTVQQNKKAGDMTNELVRHFLIETGPKGVRLKGCPNEPPFGCLSALVYQHSITPLALPCKLMIPTRDPNEEASELVTPTTSAMELLKLGAACSVLYIHSVDMESLTGPQAVAKAISETLDTTTASMATVVHFKVSLQGITLTDNQRKLFFRRHYPINTVTYCNVDPQDRKWTKADGGKATFFGFVARKQGSTTDNVSHLFAELDSDQPATAIVSFVSKVMMNAQKP